MNIGDISKRSGVSAKAIRYYESIGLLPAPDRAPNGYRNYGIDTLDRLEFIRDAQSTGLSLSEIGSIMELREEGAPTCDHVVHLLSHHISELEQRITALEETRRQLVEIVERSTNLDPAACTNPHRCQTIQNDIAPLPAAAEIHGPSPTRKARTH